MKYFWLSVGCATACLRSGAAVSGAGPAGQSPNSAGIGSAQQSGQDDTEPSAHGAGTTIGGRKKKHWVYVGGYGTTIETFRLDTDTGALTSVAITEGVPEAPTFMALDEKRRLLFAISEKGGPNSPKAGRAVSFQIDPETGKLTKINETASGGSNTVFVVPSRAGKNLLTASSSTEEGRVGVIPLATDGSLSEPSDSVIAGKNAHGLVQSPDGNFVWAVCRGAELVAQYRLDEATGKLSPLNVPFVEMADKPAGPRHIAAHPTLNVVYVLLDWSGKIVTYRYGADGALSNPTSVSIFPPDKQPHAATGTQTAAEIEVSRDGRHVYATTRTPGLQSIAVLDVDADGQLTLAANEDADGLIKGPRHFVLTSDNRHLVLANQDNHTLLVFNVDPGTGLLKRLGGATPTKVNMPNALAAGEF